MSWVLELGGGGLKVTLEEVFILPGKSWGKEKIKIKMKAE